MSNSLNKMLLIGNLGKDPEIRTFQNGGRVANLVIATSESWKDKNTGDWKERTEWHRVSIMNDPLVTRAEKYLKKGAKVYLEGQLETRTWKDKDGQDRYATEIVLRPYSSELKILEGRKTEAAEPTPQPDNDDYEQPSPFDAEPDEAEQAQEAAPRKTKAKAK